jgi:hypothetical protein
VEPSLDYHGREQYKSRQSVPYFIQHHVHYGWYPEVVLDAEQEGLLTQLQKPGPQELTGSETVLKWPLAGYLMHQLVFGENVRIAIIAEQQWVANRRYQGLLYPLDHMQDIFTPECIVRTTQELKLSGLNHVQSFSVNKLAETTDWSFSHFVLEDEAARSLTRNRLSPYAKVISLHKCY